ncbi:hypothetical protein OHB54_12285 [Streptomyces sp. NBC_01007]|nr:hypothetical protein OHB54_12285 [Streptomyces sp. NBC_01007]
MPPGAHQRPQSHAFTRELLNHAFQRPWRHVPDSGPAARLGPLSEAGARAQLGDQRTIVLVGNSSRPETVPLLVTNSADEEMVTQWCADAPADGPRAVLVTGRLRQSGLPNLVAGGIGAVAWRHEATGPRLVRAVTAVARGEADMPADLVRALMDQVGGLLPPDPGAAVRLDGTDHTGGEHPAQGGGR